MNKDAIATQRANKKVKKLLWTNEERRVIQKHYKTHSDEQIADMLSDKRNAESVRSERVKLGFTRVNQKAWDNLR